MCMDRQNPFILISSTNSVGHTCFMNDIQNSFHITTTFIYFAHKKLINNRQFTAIMDVFCLKFDHIAYYCL